MKRIVVLGAGESGAGAAVLAKTKGFETFVSDMSAIKTKYQRENTQCRRGGEKPWYPRHRSYHCKAETTRYSYHLRN